MAVDEQDWAARFAAELGEPPLKAEEVSAILALAGVAAHASTRRAAPLACFLAGRAGRSPADALALAQALAATLGAGDADGEVPGSTGGEEKP